MRKAVLYAISFVFAAALALAQSPAPQPAPAQPPQGPPPGRGGQQPMPPGPNPNSQYRLGPDSLPQEGVPKGRIRGPYTLPSNAYPGTQHTYWVYVPAQYDPATPAALMVFQDGHAFMNESGDIRAQNVMDNLIYRREIPVMIGVFINPGRTPEQPEPNAQEWGDRTTNRPTEYNSLDDKYARVITEELLPALDKEYNISKDPEMRGIGGSSSGAIAAFTVAWQRPNHFRKVLSNVGSFVNLRGGHAYPDLILSSERKPLRVFLCDGRNDNRGLRGGVYDEKRDWFYQNVRMMKALTQKGYDVNHSWSVNLHGQKYGGMIMPEMMRWLWRDGPVSTDPHDMVERSFRQPTAGKSLAQGGGDGGNDEAAVRQVVSKYVDARERIDPKAVEELFTPDADQLVSSGEWRKGRDAVVSGAMASSRSTGGRRSITVESVRFLTPDVAIADGRYELTELAGGATRSMWATLVLKRTAQGWRIAAIRNMLPAAPVAGR